MRTLEEEVLHHAREEENDMLPGSSKPSVNSNAARSQLAAARWTATTGQPSMSAGTEPAEGSLAGFERTFTMLEERISRLVGQVAA